MSILSLVLDERRTTMIALIIAALRRSSEQFHEIEGLTALQQAERFAMLAVRTRFGEAGGCWTEQIICLSLNQDDTIHISVDTEIPNTVAMPDIGPHNAVLAVVDIDGRWHLEAGAADVNNAVYRAALTLRLAERARAAC